MRYFKQWPYLLEGKGIIVKDWEPNLDLSKEKMQSFPIWVNLYNLPAEYWAEEALKEIGNTIGSFVKVEEVLNMMDSSSHPRILINMKEANPCPNFITISIVHGVRKQ